VHKRVTGNHLGGAIIFVITIVLLCLSKSGCIVLSRIFNVVKNGFYYVNVIMYLFLLYVYMKTITTRVSKQTSVIYFFKVGSAKMKCKIFPWKTQLL
jgi:hypothetical protein